MLLAVYRSDTKAPLSVVSSRYQVVQPREVLEFYRDLTQVSGYSLETAGVLKGGRKFWALARTGQSLDSARDKLACFLSGWLGGPRLYSEKYGAISIPSFHAQWPIDESHSAVWLCCMEQAIALQEYSPDFAEYLLAQLAVPAKRIVQAAASHRLI